MGILPLYPPIVLEKDYQKRSLQGCTSQSSLLFNLKIVYSQNVETTKGPLNIDNTLDPSTKRHLTLSAMQSTLAIHSPNTILSNPTISDMPTFGPIVLSFISNLKHNIYLF